MPDAPATVDELVAMSWPEFLESRFSPGRTLEDSVRWCQAWAIKVQKGAKRFQSDAEWHRWEDKRARNMADSRSGNGYGTDNIKRVKI